MTSRSAEGRLTRLAAATGALVLAVGLPAYADERDAGDREPKRIWAPEDLGEPTESVVIPLRSPAHRLLSVSVDLDGTAEVAEAPEEVDVVLDSNILFGKDSAVIRPAARARLRQVVELLRRKGPGRVEIVGYTDDLGSEQHGLVLSRQRAAAVRAIVEPRLEGFRVASKGLGEADPRVPNVDEASRAQNRRVEIHYTRD